MGNRGFDAWHYFRRRDAEHLIIEGAAWTAGDENRIRWRRSVFAL
jgi:hypothetical protein